MTKFLTATEERELIALGQAGDDSARNRVIEGILPLLYKMARQVSRTTGGDPDELVSIAVLRITEKFDNFDLKLGNRFSTYFALAAKHIMLVASVTDNVIHVPYNAFHSDATKEQAYRATFNTSLSQSLTEGGDDFSSLISDGTNTLEDVIRDEDVELLRDAIELLTEKQRTVIKMRLNGCVLDKIGAAIGFSRERVRQIHTEAIKILAVTWQ